MCRFCEGLRRRIKPPRFGRFLPLWPTNRERRQAPATAGSRAVRTSGQRQIAPSYKGKLNQ